MQKTFIFLLFVAMFSWGLSWPISKILSSMHSPFVVAFGRFALVALCLLPLIKFYKLPLKLPRSCFKWLFICVIANTLYSLVFFYAITLGNAGSAGVITTTLSPILATLLSVIIFRHILTYREILGLFIGLISGLFFLSGEKSFLNAFNLFFILTAFLWAIVTIATRKLPLHPLVLNFYSAFFSALLFVPFFAVLLSFVILGEKPELSTAIGGILAIISIYLISLYNKKHFRILELSLRRFKKKIYSIFCVNKK